MRCRIVAALLVLSSCSALCRGAEADPRKSPGYSAYRAANSAFVAQKFEDSLRLIEQALRLDPTLLPALTLKAKLAMAARNPSAAQSALEQAVRVAPESWYARFLLGFHYYMQNDMQPALTALEEALRLNPKQPQSQLYLGLVHESLGNTERAIAYYRQTIKIEESSGKLQAETLLTLGRLLLLTGELEECGKLLARAISLEPNSRDAYYELSRLLMKKGDAANAATAGEKALSLPSGAISDQQIRYVLVRAHGMAGNEQRASEHAERLRNDTDKGPAR